MGQEAHTTAGREASATQTSTPLGHLAQKFGYGVDYGLLLVFADLGEEGQGEDFAGGAFGFGEGSFRIAEALEGG